MRAPRSLLLLFALGACSTPPATLDATVDASDARPESATDAALDSSDARAPADAPPDVPRVACANTPTIEDLAALGTMMPDGLHYSSNNGSGPADRASCLQPPASCGFQAVSQRLFRYRMNSNAALRVSTNLPGTARSFDSVLFVTTAPCVLPSPNLGCNDDDPTQTGMTHLVSSLVVTPALAAGTEVLIALSGFYPTNPAMQPPDVASQTGAFELRVNEVPLAAAGAPCDASGATSACAPGFACVTNTQRSTDARCQPLGAAPGAPCNSDGTCATGFGCDTFSNRCYQTVGAGMLCERGGFGQRLRCDAGLTCVSRVRGTVEGTCVANGTALYTSCSDTAPCTGAGLACRNGSCLLAVGANAPCASNDTACPTGQSCLPAAPGAVRGTCTDDGTAQGSACRSGDVECDGALFCINRNGARLCDTVGTTPGAACGPWGVCSFDTECLARDPSRPYAGACSPAGTAGAACRTVGAQCDAGLTCVTISTGNSRCRSPAAAGASCDLAGVLTTCTGGSACARASLTDTTGTCAAAGTVAGALCASASPRCAGTLRCTTATGAGRCVQDAAAGQPCDSRYGAVLCASGSVCRALDVNQGLCDAPTAEAETNDDPTMTGSSPAGARVVTGILTRFDVDCFGLDVPAGGGVFAQATHDAGQCTDNLALDLYDPSGRPLGADSDSGPGGCPRIDAGDASSFAFARSLPAGRYAVCVRENNNRPSNTYQLSLRPLGP